MTRKEAKGFLIDISYKLGNMAIEYLTEKDGEKMREAIEVLTQESVLDKLKAEIENHCGLAKENHCKPSLYCSYCNSVMGVRGAIREILEVIDKYKTRSEG